MYRQCMSSMFLAAVSSIAAAGPWVKVEGGVTAVSTGWNANTACVYLSTSDVAKLDLSTETGRAQLSIALTAHATGDQVQVYFDDDAVLEGGCNTGTSIRPHGLYFKVKN